MKVVDRLAPAARVPDGAPEALAAATRRLGALPGVSVRTVGDIDGVPVQVVKVASTAPAGKALRVLITAGVHGNEGVGPAAAVALAELVAKDPALRGKIELTVVPCVNPEGYADHTRQNENDHADLNREFIDDGSVPREVRLAEKVLEDGAYGLSLDLHSSMAQDSQGQSGFFAIQPGGDLSVLKAVMAGFRTRFPVLDETTEKYERVDAGVFKSRNQGTLKDFMFEQGTPLAYTLEAPHRLPYELQVNGMIALVHGLMEQASQPTGGTPTDGFEARAAPKAAPAAAVLPSAEPAKLWG